MEGFWALATAALGGGALTTLAGKTYDYLIARQKTPVDQYDQLATKLAGMIEQERVHFEARLVQEQKHCDSRIARLEGEIDASRTREQASALRENDNARKIGELEGRLDEQRQMLRTVLAEEKQTAAAVALITAEAR